MRRPIWTTAALLAITFGCADQSATVFAPAEAGPDPGPPVVATDVELGWMLEMASDPYLTELVNTLDPSERDGLIAALGDFGSGVLTAPTRSYQGLESALFTFQAGAPDMSEDSDAAIVAEILELYRTWSETTLYGVEY